MSTPPDSRSSTHAPRSWRTASTATTTKTPSFAKVGCDFAAAFEYGLDLILDALEKRRDTRRPA